MNTLFPKDFTDRMRQQLGDELPAFLLALEEPAPRGIRLNPLKPAEAVSGFVAGKPILWETNGFYLDTESEAGSSILHEAGAFYIQEPAAMIPASILAPERGERILDLCAAPGGKATQIGCAMHGEGLLVCNEPVPKRAMVLSMNVERMGLSNTVVTCAFPEQLADQWPGLFDAVLVDAPCSGEGMFRRDPETRKEWTVEKSIGCAQRQKDILTAAVRLVRPGGRLVYSTCTYNPLENEMNVQWLLQTFPEFELESFYLPGIDAPEGMYTCWPHRIKGEGQFAAKLRKRGDEKPCLTPDKSLPVPSSELRRTFENTFPSFPKATHLFGKTLVSMRELPDLKGIKVLRAGLHLGEIRGKIAIPDHAAALCFQPPAMPAINVSPEDACRYMAGETIDAEADGWTLIQYRGLKLGWGKGSDGMIKNHYPKGLRRSRFIP